MIGGTITARIHTTIIAYNFKRQKYHITHIYVHQLQYEILDNTIHLIHHLHCAVDEAIEVDAR